MTCTLAVGGSALAVAKSHPHHATVADVVKDVKDANKDSADASKDKAAAQNDATTPDSAAEAQKEQADVQNEQGDKQAENQQGQQEGDNAAQAKACQGLLTDNVQYDDQTGTCTAETGQNNGTDNSGSDNAGTTGQENNNTNG
ncbi:MAG: hypothetical protein ACR2QA_09500 [Solirubrobacteraceae bacterium]